MTTRQLRILVVEDEEAVLTAISQALARRGHFVEVASDGRRGLEAIQSNPPFDLAILDEKLPELLGSQLLRYLEQESPRTEVIFVSGYTTQELRAEAVAHGAFMVLEKPIRLAQLLDVVDRLTQRGR